MARVIELDEATAVERQVPPVIETSHDTVTPFVGFVSIKVLNGPFCALTPFTLKLYEITPPAELLTAAVKVAGVPLQITCEGVLRVTTGVEIGFTTIVIEFEVAEVCARQFPLLMLI
jgi:hypothetical protein